MLNPRVSTLFTAGALGLATTTALAETPPLPMDLDWKAPPECHTAEMIHAELARIAHVRPGRTPATLVARVRIDKRGERYHLLLTTDHDGEIGERTLVASECSALGREVTLVLALAFGEGVELGSESPAPASTPLAPELEPPPQAAMPTPAAPEGQRPLSAPDLDDGVIDASLYGGGGVLLRALPHPAAQAFAGAELGTRRFWIAPRLTLVPRVEDGLERDVRARYDAAGGSLGVCVATSAASSLLAACVTGGAMAVRGRSRGAPISRSAVAPWYTTGAAVSAAWPGDGLLSARLEGSLLVSLNTPTFRVEGLGDVHTIPRLTPALALAAVLRL